MELYVPEATMPYMLSKPSNSIQLHPSGVSQVRSPVMRYPEVLNKPTLRRSLRQSTYSKPSENGLLSACGSLAPKLLVGCLLLGASELMQVHYTGRSTLHAVEDANPDDTFKMCGGPTADYAPKATQSRRHSSSPKRQKQAKVNKSTRFNTCLRSGLVASASVYTRPGTWSTLAANMGQLCAGTETRPKDLLLLQLLSKTSADKG